MSRPENAARSCDAPCGAGIRAGLKIPPGEPCLQKPASAVSRLMNSVADLDTPVVTIDLDIMRDNIRRVQAHLTRHGIGNRPHIKTHKIPAIGRMQMEAGAIGITCQKIGEVEVFADAGVADDVLLTYNILGRQKTDRLMALTKRVRRLTVVLDNDVVSRELSEAAAHAGADVRFLVECDTGFGRTGVQTPDDAL